MKKTLCLLLSTLMLISALPFVALGASTINLVDLYGIVPPTVGASPNWDIGTNDTDLKVVHVEWFDHERGVNMQSGEKFLAGRSYRLQIFVEPASGWEFRTYQNGDVFVAILNDGEQIDDSYCIYGDKDELLVQIDYDELPAAEANTIDEIILFIDQPVTGEAPSYRKVDATKYYSDGNVSPEVNGVKWYDVTDGKYLISGTGAKFICGHTYKITFALRTKDDYEFGNASAKVNGKAAVLDWYNPYMVTVTYTFDKLVCTPEFVEGEFPSCSDTGHVGYYACPCGKWYWDEEGTEPIENEEDILLPPTGAHNYEDVVATKATTSKTGKIEVKCSGCGHVKSTKKIAKVNNFTLSVTDYVYDGKNKTPKVTVKDENGKQLVKNVDYKTSIASSRSKIGKYYVKVTLIGKYSGTKNVYFYIRPGVPETLKATQSTTWVKLTWDKADGAAGYTVYRYDKTSDSYKKLKATTATSYTDKDLTAGTKYTYKVIAYGRSRLGNVYYSKQNIVIETATRTKTPAISSLTSTSKTKATVKWNNVSGETGYQVWYSTSKDGTYTRYGNAKANATSLTMSGLKSGRTYYVKIRTYTKTGSGYVYGSYSSVKSVKVK